MKKFIAIVALLCLIVMKKFIAIVALLCAVMVSSTAFAADWVCIYSDEYRTIYVDNNSIRRDYNHDDYVFRAFTKWVYSDVGNKREIERRRKNGTLPPNGINNLSHSVGIDYFGLEKGIKYIGILNRVYYNNDGIVIPYICFSFNEPQWHIILPDTIFEEVFDAIYSRILN